MDHPRAIDFATGSLLAEEVRALLDALPLDLTFVDADNVIRYYSPYRIFSRVPEHIGGDVVDCHSPAIRPRIAQMMSEFASGWRDEAEFLERHDGRLVRVTYRALHAEDGTYRGVLEIAHYADEGASGR